MGRLTMGVRPLSAALATTDLLLIRLWAGGDLSTPEILASHGAATALVGGVTLALWRRERLRTASSLLISLLLGPIGGFVLLIADLGRRGASPLIRSTPWAAAPSRAELLHAEIFQGRRRRSGVEAPRLFAEVFASGALARQQEAIAAISLNYRPEMLPALRQALASEVPALRVQAAAVYAKLRGDFGERTKVVRAAAAAGGLAPELAAEAETVAASGFVDEETAAELRTHAALVAVSPPAARRRRDDALLRPPRLRRHACGGVA